MKETNLNYILKHGCFPYKVLPPGFNTCSFAAFYLENREEFKHINVTSKCITYSIPKLGYSRRILKIPNPFHYAELCSYLIDNWKILKFIYKGSLFSYSKPEFEEEKIKNSLRYFADFRKECLLKSYKHSHELKTDISRFYPSFYTHSIEWAISSKSIAKSKKVEKSKDNIGDKIDYYVRNMQDGQTNGIPIGPYTSQIISEIINCKIDKSINEYILENKLDISSMRFIDDRYFFANDRADIELILNKLQELLAYYDLEINNQKTEIIALPIIMSPRWKILIQSFKFREHSHDDDEKDIKRIQENDIINFFSLVFELSNENPDSSIIKYASKTYYKYGNNRR